MTLDHVLFVIVTIVVVILLVLNIVVVAISIALVRSLHRLVKKAETVVDNVDGIAKTVARHFGPAALSGLVATAFKQWHGHKEKSKGKEKGDRDDD